MIPLKTIAIGDNCMDVYPSLGKSYPGGNCVNFAVYLRRLGLETAYLGDTGNDSYGLEMAAALKAEQVDISRLRRREGQTAVTFIDLVNGDRVLGEYNEGVLADFALTAADLAYIQQFDLAHSALWGKCDKYLPSLKSSRLVLSFDFADKLNSPIVTASLPYVDYAFFSYQKPDDYIRDYLIEAKKSGPKTVVATLGGNGSVAFDGTEFYFQPIIPVKVVDTLGAGDAFIAGFMYGVLHGLSTQKCLFSGTEMAARTITYFGAW